MEDVTVAVMAVATAFICSILQIFPVIIFLLMLVDAPVVHPHVDLGSSKDFLKKEEEPPRLPLEMNLYNI